MDIKDVKKLIDLAIKSDLAEFEYSEGDTKIRIVRGYSPQIQYPVNMPSLVSNNMIPPQISQATGQESGAAAPSAGGTSSKSEKLEQITSPMVGTYYRASAPDAEPFAEVGMIVEPDQTVCIIEAMKLMNEIKAEFKCKIVEILIDNGHAVEFGQPLFAVERL